MTCWWLDLQSGTAGHVETSSPGAAHGGFRSGVVMILGAVAGIVRQQRDPSLRAVFSRLRNW